MLPPRASGIVSTILSHCRPEAVSGSLYKDPQQQRAVWILASEPVNRSLHYGLPVLTRNREPCCCSSQAQACLRGEEEYIGKALS